MARRTQVTATVFDTEGFPFVAFRGNPQDVGDAVSIYVLNVANPLGAGIVPLIELRDGRESEEGD